MIRKPGEGWGRESAAVAAVRGATATGAAAARAGGRMVRGVFLCLFGGVWLFGCLGGLIGGSIPTVLGCGVIGGLVMMSGVRLLSGDRSAAVRAAEPRHEPVRGARVDYDRGKLIRGALLGVVAAVISALAIARFHGRLQFAGMITLPVFALLALTTMRKACSDLTAVSWDAQGLTIATLSGRRSAAWSEVRSVELQTVNTYAYGFLKVGTNTSLMVKFAGGGLFRGKMGVSGKWLDLEGQSLEALVLRLQAAQMGRSARPAAPQPQPQPQTRPEARPPTPSRGAVDPDAAIARYMAEQARAQPQSPPAPQAPAYAPAGPARAAFGRRGL